MLIFLSFRSLKLTIDPIDVRVLPCRARGSGRVGLKRGINAPCHLCGRDARPHTARRLDKRCRVVRAMLFLDDAAQLLFILCTLGYLACAGVVNGAVPAARSPGELLSNSAHRGSRPDRAIAVSRLPPATDELWQACHAGQKSSGNLRVNRKIARRTIDKKIDTGLTSGCVHKQKSA